MHQFIVYQIQLIGSERTYSTRMPLRKPNQCPNKINKIKNKIGVRDLPEFLLVYCCCCILDCRRCWSASLTGVAVSACLAAVAAVEAPCPSSPTYPSPPRSWTTPLLQPLWCAPAIRLRFGAHQGRCCCCCYCCCCTPPLLLLTPLVAVVPRLVVAAAVVRPCHAADAVPTPAADAAAACLRGPTTPVMAR